MNVTDIPLPNENITYPEADDGSPDSRGLVVTYDLVWPQGGVLYKITSRDAPTLCATVPITISRLPNVTNAWPEANTDSPDCAPVLGQACVDAILETGKLDSDKDKGGCRLSTSWTHLPECKDTLYSPAPAGGNEDLSSERHDNGWRGTITRGINSLESGGILNDGLMNYIYDGKESASFYTSAVNMLQILLLHSLPPSPALQNVSAREPFLACMRVKTDKLAVDEEKQGGDDSAAPHGREINWLAQFGAFLMAMIITWGL